MYLTPQECDALLAAVTALSAPGSHLLLEHLQVSLSDQGAQVRGGLDKHGVTFRSARDDIADWLGTAGWQASAWGHGPRHRPRQVRRTGAGRVARRRDTHVRQRHTSPERAMSPLSRTATFFLIACTRMQGHTTSTLTEPPSPYSIDTCCDQHAKTLRSAADLEASALAAAKAKTHNPERSSTTLAVSANVTPSIRSNHGTTISDTAQMEYAADGDKRTNSGHYKDRSRQARCVLSSANATT
jgi:hypothetical protein